jgi:hypothetical protein
VQDKQKTSDIPVEGKGVILLEVGHAPEKYFSLKVLTRELFYLRF